MICVIRIEAGTPLNRANISHRPEPSVPLSNIKNETYTKTKDGIKAISKMILVIRAVVCIVFHGFLSKLKELFIIAIKHHYFLVSGVFVFSYINYSHQIRFCVSQNILPN